MDWTALWLTCQLALITTLILLVIGTLLAVWLTSSKRWYKSLISEIINLPLILPSTVLGYYLLILCNPESPFGSLWLKITGNTLTFSFSGLVFASVIYSLPFGVKPIQQAFLSLQKQAMTTASLLGATYFDRVWTILLPLSKRGILTSMVWVFAHTIGEFGIVLMMGGAIAGKTKVISIALYEQVTQFHYTQANQTALSMLGLGCLFLLIVSWLNRVKTLE